MLFTFAFSFSLSLSNQMGPLFFSLFMSLLSKFCMRVDEKKVLQVKKKNGGRIIKGVNESNRDRTCSGSLQLENCFKLNSARARSSLGLKYVWAPWLEIMF